MITVSEMQKQDQFHFILLGVRERSNFRKVLRLSMSYISPALAIVFPTELLSQVIKQHIGLRNKNHHSSPVTFSNIFSIKKGI